MDRRAFLKGFFVSISGAILVACGAKKPSSTSSSASGTTGTSSTSVKNNAATTPPTTAGGPASFVQRVEDSNKVAFTFHASGDVALANQMLAKLADLKAPATVFAVGQWLDTNKSMARAIQAGGHELANHTYTHPTLVNLSRPGVASEITKCRDVLASQTGYPGKWFRPSGIDVPTQLMLEESAKAGYGTCVGYDVDPLDYQDPGSAAIMQRVSKDLKPGSIVSLHFGHAGTVAAIGDLVALVRSRNLTLATVSDLLS